MRVSIKRTGGFAGISEEIATLDTANLDQSVSATLESLVREADFFSSPSNPPGQKIGTDFLKYEVTVSDHGRQHTVSFNDDDAPATAPLRELVRRLTQLQSSAGF
jgi:hypothetical protein